MNIRSFLSAIVLLALFPVSSSLAQEEVDWMYFPNSLPLGAGIVSVTGEFRGKCVEPAGSDPGGGMPDIRYDIKHIFTRSELLRKMRTSWDVNAPIFGGGVDGSITSSRALKQNSLYLHIAAKALWPTEILAKYPVTPSARDQLADSIENFFASCGNHVAFAGQREAIFDVLVELSTRSDQYTRLLTLEINGGVPGVFELKKGELTDYLSKDFFKLRGNVSVMTTGGVPAPHFPSNVKLDEGFVNQYIDALNKWIELVNQTRPADANMRVIQKISYKHNAALSGLADRVIVRDPTRFFELEEKYSKVLDQLASVEDVLQNEFDYDCHDKEQLLKYKGYLRALLDDLKRKYDRCRSQLVQKECTVEVPEIDEVKLPRRFGPIGVYWAGRREGRIANAIYDTQWIRLGCSNRFEVQETRPKHRRVYKTYGFVDLVVKGETVTALGKQNYANGVPWCYRGNSIEINAKLNGFRVYTKNAERGDGKSPETGKPL